MKNLVLFTSNCFGEDRSAALIARELQAILRKNKTGGIRIKGASLISEAKDYSSRGVEVLYSSSVPPSGGFPTRSIRGFLSDIFSGSVFNIFRFMKTLKAVSGNTIVTVAVGDVPLLFLARSAQKKTPIVFLAPAKSDYIEPHYTVEENYIRKHADVILTHDAFTAKNLRKKNCNALFLGNPMVDGLEPGKKRLPLDKKLPTIGILPGSRDEAAENFLRILNLLPEIRRVKKTNFAAAMPGTLAIPLLQGRLRDAGWKIKKTAGSVLLVKDNLKVFLAWGLFPEVLKASDILIGLAGTAVEQAAAMGKPVISFTGTGPQTTVKRMEEQERLLGGAMKFIRNYPEGVVSEALTLLDRKSERGRRGLTGKNRMGKPGGAKRIADYIYKNYLAAVQRS